MEGFGKHKLLLLLGPGQIQLALGGFKNLIRSDIGAGFGEGHRQRIGHVFANIDQFNKLLSFGLEGAFCAGHQPFDFRPDIIGAFVASRYAVTWGANFIRWFIIVIILVTSADLFGIIDIRGMFE